MGEPAELSITDRAETLDRARDAIDRVRCDEGPPSDVFDATTEVAEGQLLQLCQLAVEMHATIEILRDRLAAHEPMPPINFAAKKASP